MKTSEHLSIAIDGPSGAGKSSMAKRLAAELGCLYVDTGAMYRAIGLHAVRAGADLAREDAVAALLPGLRVELRCLDGAQHIFLNGEDVSGRIRTEEMSMAASAVSAHPAVRAFLLETQREFARRGSVVMDGRDIGTVVLPDAGLKIFLTASAEARARRRCKELREKGMDTPFEEVLRDIEYRDRQDSGRAAAPLRAADDAVTLDTTQLDFEQSFEALKKLIRERFSL